MRVPAAVIGILAVLIAVIPAFNNCQHQGEALTLADGSQVPMTCYWTARAELAVAAPVLELAALLALSQRRETRRALAVLGAVLGIAVALLPTVLIGTCTMTQASCNLIMKPALVLLGTLVAGISVASVVLYEREEAHLAAVQAPDQPA